MSLRFCVFILLIGWSASELVLAHALSYQSLLDKNLKKYNIPTTPGLLDGKSPIIVDKTTAIQLGKALFWDSNVGSNGVACATCHFHAGADNRTTNQLNPGTLHLGDVSSKTFNLFDNKGGVNYELKSADFPLTIFYKRNKIFTFTLDLFNLFNTSYLKLISLFQPLHALEYIKSILNFA